MADFSGLLEADVHSLEAKGKLLINMTPDFASRNWGLVIGATDFVARDSLPFYPYDRAGSGHDLA